MKMRWLVVLMIVAAIGTTVWLALPQTPPSVRISESSAGFVLPDLQGAMQRLPVGEVVLLNFWATWCPPCRKEIPSMIELHEQFAEKGLKIVAVSVDQSRDQLASFVREYSMPFQVLHDADSAVSQVMAYSAIRSHSLSISRVRFAITCSVPWIG